MPLPLQPCTSHFIQCYWYAWPKHSDFSSETESNLKHRTIFVIKAFNYQVLIWVKTSYSPGLPRIILMVDICNHQPQHNGHSYVFTCNCSPACQCVGCSSQQANLRSLHSYRMNMMNLRKLSLNSRHRFWPTRNKQTLLANDKKVRTYTWLPNRSTFDSLCNCVAYKAQIMVWMW